MKPFLIALAVLAVNGCATISKNNDPFNFPKEQTETARDLLIGSWLGEKRHEDGTLQQWLVKRAPDGTYFIQFYVVESNGSRDSWAEVGFWGVRKPIYFTAMRGFVESGRIVPANTNDPVFYDAYHVISLDAEQFTYRSYTSGNEFTVKRVADDFRLETHQIAEPDA